MKMSFNIVKLLVCVKFSVKMASESDLKYSQITFKNIETFQKNLTQKCTFEEYRIEIQTIFKLKWCRHLWLMIQNSNHYNRGLQVIQLNIFVIVCGADGRIVWKLLDHIKYGLSHYLDQNAIHLELITM